MRVKCETCNGHGGACPDGCDDGTFEARASDLDGLRARYFWLDGQLTYMRENDTLTLCSDDDIEVVNLQPEHVQVLA